jgi:hypothetical protein
MLVLFAALALAAGRGDPVGALPVAKTSSVAQICSLHGSRTRTLVLAQAPADLGTLAVRWSQPCRA